MNPITSLIILQAMHSYTTPHSPSFLFLTPLPFHVWSADMAVLLCCVGLFMMIATSNCHWFSLHCDAIQITILCHHMERIITPCAFLSLEADIAKTFVILSSVQFNFGKYILFVLQITFRKELYILLNITINLVDRHMYSMWLWLVR